MAFVMAFYIIMTTPRFPVMLKQLVGFTDSDVSLRLKTVADQAAASSNVASLVPLRIRRSTLIVWETLLPFLPEWLQDMLSKVLIQVRTSLCEKYMVWIRHYQSNKKGGSAGPDRWLTPHRTGGSAALYYSLFPHTIIT